MELSNLLDIYESSWVQAFLLNSLRFVGQNSNLRCRWQHKLKCDFFTFMAFETDLFRVKTAYIIVQLLNWICFHEPSRQSSCPNNLSEKDLCCIRSLLWLYSKLLFYHFPSFISFKLSCFFHSLVFHLFLSFNFFINLFLLIHSLSLL